MRLEMMFQDSLTYMCIGAVVIICGTSVKIVVLSCRTISYSYYV